MELTKTERLILANQYHILSKIDSDYKDEHIYNAEIFERGIVELYDEAFESISDEGISAEISDETYRILDMYRYINNFIPHIKDSEKENLDLGKIKFEGFDGHGKHYSFMRFIVNKGDSYDEYKGKNFDSHTSASLPRYKKMLSTFEKLVNADNNFEVNIDILKELIKTVS